MYAFDKMNTEDCFEKGKELLVTPKNKVEFSRKLTPFASCWYLCHEQKRDTMDGTGYKQRCPR